MPTIWTWTFRDAKVADEGELSDVIKSIGYTLRGTRGDDFHEIGGETELGAPDPETFVEFSSLTKNQTIEIIGSAVNVEALKTQIDAWFDATIKALPFT